MRVYNRLKPEREITVPVYAAPFNIAQQASTVVGELLRDYAANPGYSHNDYSDAMVSGAEEIERSYGKVQHIQSQLSQLQEENARLKVETKRLDYILEKSAMVMDNSLAKGGEDMFRVYWLLYPEDRICQVQTTWHSSPREAIDAAIEKQRKGQS